VLGASAVVILIASGLRAVFGVFITPIEAELRWDRSSLSGIAAVSILLSGALSPFTGWIADVWGPRRVVLVSCPALGTGCVIAANVGAVWMTLQSGWRTSYLVLGIGLLAISVPLVLFFVRGLFQRSCG
jgi:MFS-type transporter involved in bile tolerance (Atg22 family)